MSNNIGLIVAEELKKFTENVSECDPLIWYLVSAKFKDYGSKVEIHLKKKESNGDLQKTFAQLRVKVRSFEDVTAFRKLLECLIELCLDFHA